MTAGSRFLVAAALLILLASPAAAQMAERVGVTPGPPTPIALEEAIRLALEQNNDLAIARLQRNIALEGVQAALGANDPHLQPLFTYERATSPVTSIIGGASNGSVEQSNLAGGTQLTGRSPWFGGRYSYDFSSTRLATTNNFQRLNPQFPASTGMTYVQPLGRNLTMDAERRQILISRTNVSLTDAQLSQALMDQLSLVEEAYWDLAFARRNVEVQATAQAQAERQIESNQRQVTQGTLAPIDVVEAETQAANFAQSLASAQQTLTEAENRLKALALTDRSSEWWNRSLAPSDSEMQQVPELSLDSAVAAALSRRPELAELDASVAQNAIDKRFFTDQARPQIDLVGRYALAGLAGTIVQQPNDPIGGGTTIPDFFSGGLRQSLANIGARRFPTASVELQIDLPLGNRTASANVARANLESTQLARGRQQLEQQIEAEVRNTLQAVQSSQQRVMAAASAARNAQQQYESEQRRFDSGIGTVFLVLERQTALVTAQAQELRARADLNQAIARLERATGGTLERHGVRLADFANK